MATLTIKCVCSPRPVPARRFLRSMGKGNWRQAVNVCSQCHKSWRTIRHVGKQGEAR